MNRTSKPPLNPNHLDWSSKQSRILTANGLAPSYYSSARGFPFRDDELPHHHLGSGSSHAVFRRWAAGGVSSSSRRKRRTDGEHDAAKIPPSSLLVGVWTRPLFAGTWEHSTSADEEVYNLQTNTLFVDVRIPRSRPTERLRHAGSVGDMTDEELRHYARQHAFGGYAAVGGEARPRWRGLQSTATGEGVGDITSQRGEHYLVCTRHHIIDWNYLPSKPRNRPNKWWAEFPYLFDNDCSGPKNVWKELSYATDDFGQHYYLERWERLDGDGIGRDGPVVAMRKCEKDSKRKGGRDGIVVVIGDHFNYLFGRPNSGTDFESRHPSAGSVIEFIDMALDSSDRRAAEHFLSVDAGHGKISSGWVIDKSVRPWNEGAALFAVGGIPEVEKTAPAEGCDASESYRVLWNGETWDVLECLGIKDIAELRALFEASAGDVTITASLDSRL